MAWSLSVPALAQSDLVPETILAKNGLTRAWSLQAELDRSRSHVTNVALFDGVLYVQTDAATIQAIDAETGKTLWSKQVGVPSHPTTPLDARGDWVAVCNGSRLFLLRRATGEIVHEKQVRNVPAGGPALSSQRVFVPCVTGMVIAYLLPASLERTAAKNKGDVGKTPPAPSKEDSAAAPLCCQSLGRAMVQPLVTRDFFGGEYIAWPSDRGYLHFGHIEQETENVFGLKYRFSAGAPIASRVAYLPPDPNVLGDAGIVFSASNNGYVFAVQDETGEMLWRFSTGDGILQSPAVIDNRVYVATDAGTLYCLTAKRGKLRWSADNVAQFVAAAKSRVYVADSFGRLAILDAASGARLGAVPADAAFKLMNSDTDRIYLIGRTGLVQCLREIEQTTPILHDQERKEAARIEAKRLVHKKSLPAKKAADEENPQKKKEAAAPRATPTPKATTPPKTPKKKTEPKQPKTPKKSKKAMKGGGATGRGAKAKRPKDDNQDPF